MRGCLTILPITNAPAVRAGRRCSPIDGGNLNRAFPGDASGRARAVPDHANRNLDVEIRGTIDRNRHAQSGERLAVLGEIEPMQDTGIHGKLSGKTEPAAVRQAPMFDGPERSGYADPAPKRERRRPSWFREARRRSSRPADRDRRGELRRKPGPPGSLDRSRHHRRCSSRRNPRCWAGTH